MAIEWKFLARKINYKQQGGAPQTLYWLVVKPVKPPLWKMMEWTSLGMMTSQHMEK